MSEDLVCASCGPAQPCKHERPVSAEALRRITAHLLGEDIVNIRAALESFPNGWTVEVLDDWDEPQHPGYGDKARDSEKCARCGKPYSSGSHAKGAALGGHQHWFQSVTDAALAEREPRTADVPCVHPGCGLPERLHGAPDRSRPTHSSHWYCSRSDHPNHRHGPRRLAVEPDGLPLDVPRLLAAITATSFSIPIDRETVERFAEAYARLGPSEDKP